MAGILDNKTRILDAIVTDQGRAQIASGRLRIEYVSLTDGAAYYEADAASGSSDATNRLYFEATSRKQDFITFETDDSGQLLGYNIDPSLTIMGNELFKKDSTVEQSGSNINNFLFVSGAGDFASLSAGMLTSSIDHFKELYMLGTATGDSIKRDFTLNNNTVKFTILNTFPWINGPSDNIASIDSISPLFTDDRLTHIPNFKFLPPLIQEPTTEPFDLSQEDDSILLAPPPDDYVELNRPTEMTYEDLMIHLNGEGCEGLDPDAINDLYTSPLTPWGDGTRSGTAEVFGQQTGVVNLSTLEVARERKLLYFTETSIENNIVMQLFEINDETLQFTKLDVIDYGEVIVSDDTYRSNKHIFFAGKTYFDSNGSPTFVNLFTIILD